MTVAPLLIDEKPGMHVMTGQNPDRRLLIVDDDPATLRLLVRQFQARHFEVTAVADAASALKAALATQFDAALLDYSLGGTTGLSLFTQLREIDGSLTVVFISGMIDVADAVRALQMGAEDVQLKPLQYDLLQATLERGLHRTALQRARRLVAPQVLDPYGLFDSSPLMQRTLRRVQSAAAHDVPIVLAGESGTGKHAFAEIVHQCSRRNTQPFLTIAANGRAGDELERALRDLVAIATSGADAPGTLLLRDVEVLSAGAQKELMQLMPTRDDADSSLALPRVVITTQRNLTQDALDGVLNRDLHQRLAAFVVHVPALRERGAPAIRAMVTRKVQRMRIETGEGPQEISSTALDWLSTLPWPGNVPQLREVVRESFTLAVGATQLDTALLEPSLVRRGMHAGGSSTSLEDWSLHSAERRHVASVLAMTGNHRSRAAQLLGITRSTLYKKIAEFGLDTATG